MTQKVMAKQEEIRKGIAEIMCESNNDEYAGDAAYLHYTFHATKLLEYLHSQGVVIKVVRDLPDNPHQTSPELSQEDNSETATLWLGFYEAQQDMVKAGYEAVEPLVIGGINNAKINTRGI